MNPWTSYLSLIRNFFIFKLCFNISFGQCHCESEISFLSLWKQILKVSVWNPTYISFENIYWRQDSLIIEVITYDLIRRTIIGWSLSSFRSTWMIFLFEFLGICPFCCICLPFFVLGCDTRESEFHVKSPNRSTVVLDLNWVHVWIWSSPV